MPLNSSPDIVRFLNGILAAREQLQTVLNHYRSRKLKVHWNATFGPIWSQQYLEYGLMVTGSNGRNYDLSARIRWPGDDWIIEAEACLEEEDTNGNWYYPTLRALAPRRTENWQEAIEWFPAAVRDLQNFGDLIP